MRFTISTKGRVSALRRMFAAFALIVSAFCVSAETYVLDSASLKSAFSMSEKATSYSTNFTQGDATWHLDIGLNQSFQLTTYTPKDGHYLLFMSGGTSVTNSVSLKSDFFKDKMIKSVIIDACCYCGSASRTDVYAVTITDDAQSVTSSSVSIITSGYPTKQQQQKIVTFNNVDRLFQGSLGISFTSTVGFEFAINSITIEYSAEVPPVVNLEETIPVGHPLWLTADKEEAAIYYTVDGTENWQTYDPERGVVFDVPGTYTLKYYATAGEVSSDVVSEEIRVERPTGFAAARAANEAITISGVVCGTGDGYVLLGENAESNPADCIAIETKDYSQLKEVAIGTTVTATGRPTDRFGSVKGLGSISALEIDGKPLEPAAIKPAINAPAPTTHYYDLTGRRVDPRTGNHTRRILISPDGAKHLTR